MRNIYVERMEKSVLEECRGRKMMEIMRMVIRLIVMLAAVFAAGVLFSAVRAMAAEAPAVIYQDADQAQANAIEIQEAPPINDVSVALDEQDANGHQLEYLGEFTLTYYCPCRKCNGSDNAGIDGFGNPLKWGTVAVDPKVIKMHTKLVIDGYDAIFEALDTGSGVDGKHIDVFVPVSHSKALQMGQYERRKVWRWAE